MKYIGQKRLVLLETERGILDSALLIVQRTRLGRDPGASPGDLPAGMDKHEFIERCERLRLKIVTD